MNSRSGAEHCGQSVVEWLQSNGVDTSVIDFDMPVMIVADDIIQWHELDGSPSTTWCHVRPDPALGIIVI